MNDKQKKYRRVTQWVHISSLLMVIISLLLISSGIISSVWFVPILYSAAVITAIAPLFQLLVLPWIFRLKKTQTNYRKG